MPRELSEPPEIRRRAALLAASGAAALLLVGCTIPIDTGLGGPKRSAAPQPDTVTAAVEASRRAYETGNPEEGDRMVRRAEEVSDQDPGEKPYLASTLTSIALQQSQNGNNEEALELHERALRLREEAFGPSHPEVAESLTFLAAAYYQAQRYDDAERAFARAAEIRRTELGADHRLTGLSVNNLAFFYAGIGKYDQAEPLFVESIGILEAAPDATWDEKARALDNYAAMLHDAGRAEDAATIEAKAATYRTEYRRIEDIMKTTR